MTLHSPTQVFVHVVWATLRRLKTLSPDQDTQLHVLLHEAVRSAESELVAVGNASDHVHALVRISAKISLAALAQRMKGRTSYYGGWRWQRGYFAESISAADVEATASYVRDQRRRHDPSHPMETWLESRGESAEGGLDD